MKDNPFKAYMDKFTEQKFWKKLSKFARQAGIKVVYSALLMFYAYRRKDTPGWAKRIVIGTLGYLISPIDAIPDLTPILGYTDDLGILSFGLVTIAAYINKEVKSQSKERLKTWFGNFDPEALSSIDNQL